MYQSPALRRGIEILLVTAILFALACAFTWPAITNPGGYLFPGDPYLITSLLENGVRGLLHNPATVFNAPFFYPHKDTLAYSDSLLGLQPLYLPLRAFGFSPAAGYNLLVMLGFILSGLALYLFSRFRIGLSPYASLFAAIVYAFCHYRMEKVHQLHLLYTLWFPIALWLVCEIVKRNRWLPALALALIVASQAYISLYYLVYIVALIGLAAFFLADVTKDGLRAVWKIIVAGVFGLVLVIPLALPYLHLHDLFGFSRSANDVLRYSAGLQHLLAPTAYSSFPYPAFIRSFSAPEMDLFIGLAASIAFLAGLYWTVKLTAENEKSRGRWIARLLAWTGLALLVIPPAIVFVLPGYAQQVSSFANWTQPYIVAPLLLLVALFLRSRWTALDRRWGILALALVIVGVLFALGPRIMAGSVSLGSGPYALIANLPFFGGFRVAARWFVLAITGAALLAGFGVEWTKRRWGTYAGAAIAISLCALAIWEYAPLRGFDMPLLVDTDQPVYRWLERQPAGTTVLELPLSDPVHGESIAMFAQLRHGKPIVNGYSGFLSPQFESLYSVNNELRTPGGLAILRSVPCTTIVAHLDRLTAAERTRWLAFAAEPDATVRWSRRFGTALVFSLGWGGDGKHFAMYAPPEVERLSCTFVGQNLTENLREFAEISIDGTTANLVPLTAQTTRFDLSLKNADPGRSPHMIGVDYQYLLDEPERTAGAALPFRLDIESGGCDPNHCIVGINGRYWPREKGFNFYRISPDGRVLEWKSFNTSWFAAANEDMKNYLSTAFGPGEYLLLVSRHRAGRLLDTIGINALRAAGFVDIAEFQADSSYIGLIRADVRRSLIARTAAGKAIAVKSAGFESNGSFSCAISLTQDDE